MKFATLSRRGAPYQVFKRVVLETQAGKKARKKELKKNADRTLFFSKDAGDASRARARAMFKGHYEEPELYLPIPDDYRTVTYQLTFNHRTREWAGRQRHNGVTIAEPNALEQNIQMAKPPVGFTMGDYGQEIDDDLIVGRIQQGETFLGILDSFGMAEDDSRARRVWEAATGTKAPVFENGRWVDAETGKALL